MILDFTTPLTFVRIMLTLCELYALLSFGFLFLMRGTDPKDKPHWARRLRTLALWHLLVPPVLYGLQFLLPALAIFMLGLLLMMISLHILREWFIDPDKRWKLRTKNTDFAKLGCLPHLIVQGQFEACFGLMGLAIYNILLLSAVSSPLLDLVGGIGGTVAWGVLDFVVTNVLWQKPKEESFKQLGLWEEQGWTD